MKYDKNTLEQLKKIERVIIKLKSQGKTQIYKEDLEKYLSKDEINLLYEIYNNKFGEKTENISKAKEKVVEEMLKLLTETPYTVLEIENNKDYDKEELLEIVKKRIEEINSLDYERVERQNKIDKVLDAYNIIMKDRKNQKHL